MDDQLETVSIHGFCGLWALLASGIVSLDCAKSSYLLCFIQSNRMLAFFFFNVFPARRYVCNDAML